MDLHQFLISEKKKDNVFYVIKFLSSFIEAIKTEISPGKSLFKLLG